MSFTNNCPCGTGKSYLNCCGMFISGQHSPTTPEALMRSRYTAYTQKNMNYIAQTMKPPAADAFDIETTRKWAEEINWIELIILKSSNTGLRGSVEFLARYYQDNKKQTLHEKSEFQFIDKKWYYINGVHDENQSQVVPVKIGRNDLCPCGSHKKFKKCCGL